jgi:hypothetical protein
MNIKFNAFQINGHWIAGFTEAEGCFSISMFDTQTNSIGVQFCFYLVQKNRELLQHCATFIDAAAAEFKEFNHNAIVLKKGKGTMNIEIRSLSFLKKVMHPFFSQFSLYGSKFIDCQLFLKLYLSIRICLSVVKNVC